MVVIGHVHTAVTLSPWKSCWFLLNRKLERTHDQYGRFGEICWKWNRDAAASSPLHTCHTDSAMLDALYRVIKNRNK
jgi:hypothetical protein